MQLILTDDVIDLGRRGQVVNVAQGYGRNYLLPKGLAIPATEANLKLIEEQRVELAKKEASLREESEVLAGELNQLHLVVSRKAGDTGVLFGSVTSKDLGELLEANGFHVDRRKIRLEHPLKNIGNETVEVYPHSEVKAELLVSVLVEEDEVVARVLKKGEESEQIAAQAEAKAKELAEAVRAEAEAAAAEEAKRLEKEASEESES